MKNRNWFWGSFFLLAAIFVLASQFGSFGEIGILSILATVLLVAIIIHSAIRLNFFGIFLPVAFLYPIYQKPLGFVPIGLWLLVFAAVLASIGFSCIFHPNHHWEKWVHHGHGGIESMEHTSENIDDNNPYSKVSFGASSKYLHGDSVKSGQFLVSFGSLEVFFDQAQLSPEGAEMLLDCKFGSIKLFIPRTWRVYDNLHASLGSVENDMRIARPTEDSPCLTLNGSVELGSVEIHYI